MLSGKRRPRYLAVAGTVVGALLVAGCSTGATPTDDSADDGGLAGMEPIKIVLSDINPEASVIGRAWTGFMDEVTTKTEGKITFDTYWSSALMPLAETLSGVQSGVVGVAQILPNNYPQELPISNLVINMGSMPSDSFPLGTIQGAAAAQELFSTSEEWQAEMAENNMKALAVAFPYIQYDLLCTTPVTTEEEAAGKRVRTPGGVWNGELEALGMIPVPLPFGEAYDALQRGVIDCVALQPAANMDSGLVDIAQEFTPVALSGYLGAFLGINLDTWNSLPVEAQQIMQDAAVTWWAKYEGGAITRYADEAIEGVDERGLTFHDPSELDAIVSAAQKKALTALGKTDTAGLESTADFIDKYQGLLDKWEGILVDELEFEVVPRDASSIQKSWASGRDFNLNSYLSRIKEDAFDPYRVK